MPTYEYECEKCGHRFEVRRGMFQTSEKMECPACKGKDCHQVYSGFSTGNVRTEGCAPPSSSSFHT